MLPLSCRDGDGSRESKTATNFTVLSKTQLIFSGINNVLNGASLWLNFSKSLVNFENTDLFLQCLPVLLLWWRIFLKIPLPCSC